MYRFFIHIVMAKRKCSINDGIKSEYPFIEGVNEIVLSCQVFYQTSRGSFTKKWKCPVFF
jgi:hypothetical protein